MLTPPTSGVEGPPGLRTGRPAGSRGLCQDNPGASLRMSRELVALFCRGVA
jgi:hypothetical protein